MHARSPATRRMNWSTRLACLVMVVLIAGCGETAAPASPSPSVPPPPTPTPTGTMAATPTLTPGRPDPGFCGRHGVRSPAGPVGAARERGLRHVPAGPAARNGAPGGGRARHRLRVHLVSRRADLVHARRRRDPGLGRDGRPGRDAMGRVRRSSARRTGAGTGRRRPCAGRRPRTRRWPAVSVNAFGLDLYRGMLADPTLDLKAKNAVFSPTSIGLALAMARAGARGLTREPDGRRAAREWLGRARSRH